MPAMLITAGGVTSCRRACRGIYNRFMPFARASFGLKRIGEGFQLTLTGVDLR